MTPRNTLLNHVCYCTSLVALGQTILALAGGPKNLGDAGALSLQCGNNVGRG